MAVRLGMLPEAAGVSVAERPLLTIKPLLRLAGRQLALTEDREARGTRSPRDEESAGRGVRGPRAESEHAFRPKVSALRAHVNVVNAT